MEKINLMNKSRAPFLAQKPKIRIIFNRVSNTLDIWFDEPKKEFICEETGEEIILKKDKNNRVIGFEKLNVLHDKNNIVPFEIISI